MHRPGHTFKCDDGDNDDVDDDDDDAPTVSFTTLHSLILSSIHWGLY